MVCKEEYIAKLNKLIAKHWIQKVVDVIPGGNTGMDSIFKGLSRAYEDNNPDDIVLIHDGVRPFVADSVVEEAINCAEESGNAITCTALFETPIVSDDGMNVTDVPDRRTCYTAQAPQCFHLGEILDAHRKIREKNPMYEGIVDNCTLMKNLGRRVYIVKGNRGNIKVTTPEDLYIFRAMLQYRETRDAYGFSTGEIASGLKRE